MAKTRCGAAGRSRPALVSARFLRAAHRQQLFRSLREDQWAGIMPELLRLVLLDGEVGFVACLRNPCASSTLSAAVDAL
jgi:hypothetical protein